jgi:FkbM family methyltransferase
LFGVADKVVCASFDYAANSAIKNIYHQCKEKFVEIVYSNLMSTSLGLETDINNSENHALIGKQFLEEDEDNFNFGAIANQLNNILSKANAPKQIDFLSLDVEGAEIEVLKGINHNEYRFKFICIESRDIQKINNYLTINNYLLIKQFSPIDYLFKDKELK